MKKVTYLILIILCSMGLLSCNNNSNSEKGNLSEVAKELGIAEYKEIKGIDDRDVFVSDNLKKIYKSYMESEDINLLVGLEPIDVFRLYNSAVLDEKYDGAGSLINYPSDIDKNEFLKEWEKDDVTKENEKKLFKRYVDKESEVYQVIIDEQTSFIVFISNDERYRFEWVEPGIWKIGWLARQ